MQETMECLNARFFGKVQGIGFRGFAMQNALKLGLKGWVKNCEDGSVELEAFGKKEALEKLLKEVQEGFAARIEQVEKEFSKKQCAYSSFSIRF
ncbi:MAG TPA: acylphosphatase [Candidatus Diapherotrites archaeon]|uniref:acylphosphatase n=1 Tax=Candidatus Iainarchaeum sp. TaxID=3101447 RepID=A0A7J4JW96_9ARCH|nr:acylphosphatase [Candidatus Diapherotrites archaeon]HIH32847.1 acylphosphatase [Candidatus Diapherotrites archaeon]